MKTLQEMRVTLRDGGNELGAMSEAIRGLASPLGVAGAAFIALSLGVHAVKEIMLEHLEVVRSVGAFADASAEQSLTLVHSFEALGLESSRLNTALFRLGNAVDMDIKAFGCPGNRSNHQPGQTAHRRVL
jgi:hypothetical protein